MSLSKRKEDVRHIQDLIDSFKSKTIGNHFVYEPVKAYSTPEKDADEFHIPGDLPPSQTLESMTLDELKVLRQNIDNELSKRKKETIEKIIELLGRFSE